LWQTRHDTSVDDRASTKFKERAEAGHSAPSDAEVFTNDAQKALVEDLVKGKQYEEAAAKEIAAAVLLRRRKVTFVEASVDMDAFFSVESKPGGVTEIVFNRSHPAYDLLIRTLDADASGATERDLVHRIQNASDTIKMLFAAWARQEVEDVPARERIRRMRQDWGRMARDFLTDEKEE
jgi:xanthine/CO dehydrogenase XdhC/CoxF family maturation factor